MRTLLVKSGTSFDPSKLHLFVICTDECEKGKHVLVPVCKLINDLCDKTCLLNTHEHPFLTCKSYILYRKARIESSFDLISGVTNRHFKPREDMNGQTFLRIKNGLCASPHTPRKIKFYLRCVSYEENSLR